MREDFVSAATFCGDSTDTDADRNIESIATFIKTIVFKKGTDMISNLTCGYDIHVI